MPPQHVREDRRGEVVAKEVETAAQRSSSATVRHLISRTLQTAENRAAEEMRELENARLDRAQAAIWGQVLAGDYRAVMVFLQISQRRAKLNGLDSPASVVISPNVRAEMERALFDLQQVMNMVSDDRPD